jgi:iron complex outermembrane receptor protein
MRTTRGTLALALLLSCSMARGAEDPPRQAEVLEEIEVKGKKDARVETVEAREVRESPAADLGEALANEGLVYKIRKGAIANDVVIRAFQKDNLTVTIDGALLHGACPNRMDPAVFHLDYSEIDRIEVKKGPYDVSVPGSLGGNINVDTRKVHPGVNAEGNLQYGAFNRFAGSAVLGYGLDWADVQASYAYKFSEPYLAGNGASVTAIYPLTSQNRYRVQGQTGTAYSINTAWAQAGASLLGNDRLQAAYSYQGADSVIYPYLLMDAVYDDTQRVNASYEVSDVGPFARVFGRFYWNGVSHLMNDARRCSSASNTAACTGALPREYSMESLASSGMVGGKLEGVTGKSNPLTFGVDLYSRLWDATTTRIMRATGAYGTQASIPDVNIFDLGLYGEYQHRIDEAWKLSAGVRFDWATSTARLDRLPTAQADIVLAQWALFYGPGMPQTANDYLVSGNVQVDWQVSEPVALFLGVGSAARVPDPQERFFALSGSRTPTGTWMPGRVGFPELAAPRNNEMDLGVRLATSRLLVKGQIFGSIVNDYIVVGKVAAPSDPTISSQNYQNVLAYLAGFEASARYALPWNLYLSGSLAFTYGQQASPAQPLQEVPPLAGSVGLRWDDRTFFAEVDAPFAATQNRVDTAMNETTTPGWIVANVRAGAQWKGFKLFGGVSNVFNRYYFEFFNYLRSPYSSGQAVPEPGRAFYVALQYAM